MSSRSRRTKATVVIEESVRECPETAPEPTVEEEEVAEKKGKGRKVKKPSVPGTEVHHEFEDGFIKEYTVLITMLLERGYSGDGLIGVQPIPPDHTPSPDDLDDGIIGQWQIVAGDDIDNTKAELTKCYGGLEKFSLRMQHQNSRLNMLVYYLLPEVEAHGSTQERKQLSESQITQILKVFDTTDGFSRLLIISKVKLSADASALITQANYRRMDEQPLRLVAYMPTSFLRYNIARWHLQPHDVKIYRGVEKQQVLDELGVAAHRKGQEENLLPQISEADPLCIYYGARVGDVISYIREIPTRTLYMRLVVYDLELV